MRTDLTPPSTPRILFPSCPFRDCSPQTPVSVTPAYPIVPDDHLLLLLSCRPFPSYRSMLTMRIRYSG